MFEITEQERKDWFEKNRKQDKADIAMLRAALIGMVGAESEDELKNFRAAMGLMSIPDAEKQVMLNAIAALQKTTGGF